MSTTVCYSTTYHISAPIHLTRKPINQAWFEFCLWWILLSQSGKITNHQNLSFKRKLHVCPFFQYKNSSSRSIFRCPTQECWILLKHFLQKLCSNILIDFYCLDNDDPQVQTETSRWPPLWTTQWSSLPKAPSGISILELWWMNKKIF